MLRNLCTLVLAAGCGLALTAETAVAQVNNTCLTATVINPAALPFSDSQPIVGANDGSDVDVTCNSGTVGRYGIWYQFTPTASGLYTLSETSTNDTAMAVFTGACGGLTQVFCTDPESASFAMTADTPYYIEIVIWSSTANPTVNFGFLLQAPAVPPANDTCATATVINPASLPFADSVDARASNDGADSDSTCNSGTVGRFGIWYQFTPTASGSYDMAEAGTTDTATSVWTGVCGALTQVFCSDPETSQFVMSAGTTYYIQITIWSSTATPTANYNFTLLQTPPPPSNDTCAGAIPLACGGSVSGSVQYATVETLSDVPASTCPDTFEGGANLIQNLRKGVWYTLVGTGNTITLSTCNAGTNFDSQISVFSGVCGALACYAGGDDAGASCSIAGTRSIVTFATTLGTTYYVMVTPFSTAPATFAFQLDVTCNSGLAVNCNTASPANVVPGGSTVLSAAVSPASVPPSTGIVVTVDLTQIGGGAAVPMLDDGVAPDGAIDGTYTVGATVDVGTTIGAKTLAVAASDAQARTASCDISLNVINPPPANDTCAGAIALTCGSSVTGSINDATNETLADVPGATCPDTGEGGTNVVENLRRGLWYTIVGTGDAITLTTCNAGTNFDTQVTVFTGACGALACFAANDDDSGCASSGLRSTATFASTLGTTYYVMVSNWSATTTTGNFQLDASCITPPPPPANDDCGNAITVGVGSANGTNVNATGTDISSCAFSDTLDVWYSFTAASGGTYRIDTNLTDPNAPGALSDTTLALYAPPCLGAELTCDDDGGTGLLSQIDQVMAASETVLIRVAGYSGGSGSFVLTIGSLATGCPVPGCDSGGVDADFNDDCQVLLDDLSVLLTNFGSSGGQTNATGDTNADTNVDLTDLSNLLARFGLDCR
jgi:hypothetical protein